MNTNRLYRLLAIAAVLVMALSAAGCGRFSFCGKLGEKLAQKSRTASVVLNNISERVIAASAEAQEKAQEAERAAQATLASEEGIWNILLIGSDRRDSSWNGNSDTMILVSVNQNTQNYRMVSFMRDTYVNIPGVGGRKLNSAYAIAGAPLLMQTLRDNFGVKVDNYVSVDFSAMVAVINTMGGVDIDLNAAEAGFMGLPAGPNHLNGELALLYSRIRKIGNADYERTSRQRRVLSAMFSQLRNMDNLTRVSVATQMLSLVTTDIGADKIAWLLANIGSLMNYNIITERVPFDGLYGHSGENLVPDYPATRARLYEFLH